MRPPVSPVVRIGFLKWSSISSRFCFSGHLAKFIEQLSADTTAMCSTTCRSRMRAGTDSLSENRAGSASVDLWRSRKARSHAAGAFVSRLLVAEKWNESDDRSLNCQFVKLSREFGTPVRSAGTPARFTAGAHAPRRGQLYQETPGFRAQNPGVPAPHFAAAFGRRKPP